MKSEINTTVYIMHLEECLAELHSDISRLVAALPPPVDLRDFDAYVYELNNFYYRGFDEKIFPSYRKILQDDLNNLLSISLHENTLKEGILSSIKRYAQLYNQVKKLMTVLSQGKENTYEQLLHINREEDRRVIELSTALRQWRGRLQWAALFGQNLSDILADKDLLSHLKRDPFNIMVLKFIEPVELDNPINAAAYNAIIANLRVSVSLLGQIQKDEKVQTRLSSTLKSMQEKIRDLSGKRAPSSIQALSSFISDKINRQLQNLDVYARHAEQKLFANALRQLDLCLDDLITIMDKSQNYILSGHREALIQLSRSIENQVFIFDSLSKNISDTVSELDELLDMFSSSSQPDFHQFSVQIRVLLEKVRDWMESSNDNRTIVSSSNVLISSLHHALLELQYLIRWLDLMENESRSRIDIHNAHLSFLNDIDFLLNFLGNVRADLERMLASRNLARLWKDLAISVDRIPLEKGRKFPTQHLPLLVKYSVQEKWGDYEDYTILYEEGDLFIIRVAGEYTEELPSLTIGRKK